MKITINLGHAIILIIVAGIMLTHKCSGYSDNNKHSQPYYDTIAITYHDTVLVFKPVPKDTLIKKYVKVPVPDTVLYRDTITDTVYAHIPIYQYHFQDSTYNLYVSGYRVSLDSLFVYPQQTILQLPSEPYKERSRFSFGLQGGITLMDGKPRTYIGIGATYNIFYFKKNSN